MDFGIAAWHAAARCAGKTPNEQIDLASVTNEPAAPLRVSRDVGDGEDGNKCARHSVTRPFTVVDSSVVQTTGSSEQRNPSATSLIEAQSKERAYEQLLGLLPAKFFVTPGHSDASIWHAVLGYISDLTGQEIMSAFDTHLGADFSTKDELTRELVLANIPPGFFHDQFGVNSNYLAVTATTSYIKALVSVGNRTDVARSEEGEIDGEFVYPASSNQQIHINHEQGAHGSSSKNPGPTETSQDAVQVLEDQQRMRAEQIRMRDEAMGRLEELPWNTEAAMRNNPSIDSTEPQKTRPDSQHPPNREMQPPQRAAAVGNRAAPQRSLARKLLLNEANRIFPKKEMQVLSDREVLHIVQKHVDHCLLAMHALLNEVGDFD